MKLALIEHGATTSYAVLTPNGAVPIPYSLEELIDSFDTLRPRIQDVAAAPLTDVRLLPPVPQPGKILVTTATYGTRTDPLPQLLATLKSAESVIGPDQTVHLPDVDATAWQFVPQGMLGLVIRGPAKDVPVERWQSAVFGYTCVIDVMAKGDQMFGRDYWLAKSDTLGPLGPCIVTLDEIPDPTTLRVRTWQNDSPAQDFLVREASHSIAEQLALATTVMTLHTGDVLACGTAQDGARPLSDGDTIDLEIDGVGRLSVRVAAPVRTAA
jgi:2-keto-4-pentenoate hydratase/2-oxohepta-3-ene-1,7-dioic acid hydratase in catechol pathway